MAGYGAARDPVSVIWDGGAAALLRRAYAQKGGWVSTIIADPKPRHSPCWGFILHDLVRGVRVVVPCADWTINRTGS